MFMLAAAVVLEAGLARVGDRLPITGSGLGATQVVLWLEPYDAPLALRPGYRRPHAPFGVRIAAANVTRGQFATTWTVKTEVGRMKTGGILRLGPRGHDRAMLVAYDAAGRFLADAEVTVDDRGPKPARPQVTVQPADPCPGQPVTLVGRGYPAGLTYFDLHTVPDQGVVPLRPLGQVRVGADGRFSFTFTYARTDVKPGMLRTGVSIYDAELHERLGRLKQCNGNDE